MKKYVYEGDSGLDSDHRTNEIDVSAQSSESVLELPEGMRTFELKSLSAFLQNFFDGKLDPSIRSEEVPVKDTEGRSSQFRVLVGSNFEDM